MFDFFKDLYLEMNDFDMEKVREERQLKIEEEKAETIIFKKKTKLWLLGVGAFFILFSVVGILISIEKNNIGGIIKSATILTIDLITMVCMMIKTKQTEVASLIGMAIMMIIIFVVQI